jgi:hypothetical protein
MGYQHINNLVKDKNGDLIADSHDILNRWKNYFSQLLNVHNVSSVRQIKIHTAEPLVLDPSPLKLKLLLRSDQIMAELIKAWGKILLSEIHKVINFIRNKEELPEQLKESTIVPIYKKRNSVVIIVGYHCYQFHTELYSISFSQG